MPISIKSELNNHNNSSVDNEEEDDILYWCIHYIYSHNHLFFRILAINLSMIFWLLFIWVVAKFLLLNGTSIYLNTFILLIFSTVSHGVKGLGSLSVKGAFFSGDYTELWEGLRSRGSDFRALLWFFEWFVLANYFGMSVGLIYDIKGALVTTELPLSPGVLSSFFIYEF